MPYLNDDDPGWRKVQEKVAEALAPFAADFGARECAHGDWADCDANDGAGCQFADTQPKSGSMPVLTEFVVVSVVADMGTDKHDICACTSPNMRNHSTKGLLHVALYE